MYIEKRYKNVKNHNNIGYKDRGFIQNFLMRTDKINYNKM